MSIVPGQVSRAAFRPLVFRALLLPVAVILVFAAALVWQVAILLNASALVEQTDLVIAQANALEKLHVDLETGLRGYLLNYEDEYLDPYTVALAKVDSQYDALLELVGDNPVQTERFHKVRNLKDQWLEYSLKRLADRRMPDFRVDLTDARNGKRLMDGIRKQFVEILADEEALRDERSRQARRSVRFALVSLGVLAAFAAIALVWLTRRNLTALAASYEGALHTADELTHRLEQRVEQRTRQLAEANEELEAFSYSVSHDLRAPMRHISGFVHILQKSLASKLSDEDRENLAIIADTSMQAGLMVDALLAFSRVGRTELSLAPVDTAALVQEVRRSLELETAARNVVWRIGPLPIVEADAALLRLVFQNLLANAVKYTAGVSPALIEVGSEPRDGQIRFFVRDNGTGFDMQYVDKLFGVFQRLHRAEDFEGTGIGLANVRRIVLRHGGAVTAEGAINQGATFTFTLPQQSDAAIV